MNHEMRYTSLASQVMQRRAALGLTQMDLARRAGVSQATISRIESGARDPRASIIAALAEILGISADTLLGRSPHTS